MLEQSHAAKPPFRILALVEKVVAIKRLMCSMEATHSNVHNGLADFLTIVARDLDFRIEFT
jgi:hypothetical protein